MTLRLLPILFLIAVIVGQSGSVAYATEPDIADFMIMDVCVNNTDQILPLVPGDSNCNRRRNIRPGELPPYILRNFGKLRRDCPSGTSTIERLNLPVVRDGQTRIVSSNTPLSPSCQVAITTNKRKTEGGASIQWYDDGYGFIMGSYSPVALSIYQAPDCQPGKLSSRRFFRGWVIAPARVPVVGDSGYGVFQSLLTTGAASDLSSKCPASYRRALTTWLVTNVNFKSGRTMVAIVSGHFANVSPDGTSPGKAMQLEQSYWTREFGLSRWEKWARADWVHPRNGRAVPDLARQLFRQGRCSPPAVGTFDVSAHTRFSDDHSDPHAYTRIITNPTTGERHIWYMTLCEDYTNIHQRPLGQLPDTSHITDKAYWIP